MKLFGGFRGERSRGAKKINKNGADKRRNEQDGEAEHKHTPAEEAEIEEMISSYQKYKKRKRIAILAVVAVLLAAGFALFKLAVRPPDIARTTPPGRTPPPATATPADQGRDDPEETPAPTPSERQRRKDVYTFLLLGAEQSYGNTDAILVGVYDAAAGEVNVLSIPRDTCANVESDPLASETKKISGVYARAGFDGIKDAVGDIVGFPVDSYVMVGVSAFTHLVDTVGGIWFDVPYYMNYDDPTQNLHIHFNTGYQYLNGTDTLKVVRWRQNNDGTGQGDIARIQTQQNVLKTVIKQCLSLSNITSNLTEYVDIFNTYVKTDMNAGNMLWYAQQFIKLDMENIHFYTMPALYNDNIRGFAYGTVYVDELLEMLNEHFNIYDQPITIEDLNVISRDEKGELYATSGEIAGGYDSFLSMEQYEENVRRYEEYLASLNPPAEEDPAPEAAPPAEEPPAEGTPAEDTPPEGTPAEGTPAEGTPAENTPAEGTPAEDTPPEEALPGDEPLLETETEPAPAGGEDANGENE